jgi:gamma-glutamyl:cysteine ligase YbdK (ATP-grasp superfamily)
MTAPDNLTIDQKIDYLFSKINWKDSAMDAQAIKIMNELKSDISEEIGELSNRLSEGRDYLMQVGDYPFDVSACFESFGFGANGEFPH